MMDEAKLIFIISQPRSGSTLLQKLVSNNEYVDTVSEPWLLLPLLSPFKPSLIRAEYNYETALTGFFDYLGKKNDKEGFRNELKHLILNRYKVNGQKWFVDKTPRYYEIADVISEFFPSAKFLILKRNPFASLYSMITTWSKGKIEFATMDTYYRDFLIAPFQIQEFAEKNSERDNFYEVNYENLVADPQSGLKNIYNWLRIPFTPAALDIAQNDKVKGLFGDDVYKKRPLESINPSLSDNWQSVKSDKLLSRFFAGYQNYLGEDFIKRYGYQRENFPTGFTGLSTDQFGEYMRILRKSGRLK